MHVLSFASTCELEALAVHRSESLLPRRGHRASTQLLVPSWKRTAIRQRQALSFSPLALEIHDAPSFAHRSAIHHKFVVASSLVSRPRSKSLCLGQSWHLCGANALCARCAHLPQSSRRGRQTLRARGQHCLWNHVWFSLPRRAALSHLPRA